MQSFSAVKTVTPVRGAHDPCPPLKEKSYRTPPHLYMGVQPPGLPQYSPAEALRKGTLWRAFDDPYVKKGEKRRG